MANIIYQGYRNEFGCIPVGEFFAAGTKLHLKLDKEQAFNFSKNEIVSFNTWDDVTEVDATITAKF